MALAGVNLYRLFHSVFPFEVLTFSARSRVDQGGVSILLVHLRERRLYDFPKDKNQVCNLFWICSGD